MRRSLTWQATSKVEGAGDASLLLILFLAPFFGEGLSGSTPPLDLLLSWNLAFMVALYGCGAFLCREVSHRFRLGLPGLVLLGVAYAIWEEALVDRYWFLPSFWSDSGIHHYSVVWHTNVLLAAHLTVFHTAVTSVHPFSSPSACDRKLGIAPGPALLSVS